MELINILNSCVFRFCAILVWLLLGIDAAHAEGSLDLAQRPGSRFHLDGSFHQQFKVFARAGEYINVGASNLGFGGKIEVFSPTGTLVATFDDPSLGVAVIENLEQELAGPVGGFAGYKPGVVAVDASTQGIWSVVFSSDNANTSFNVFPNDYPWTRMEDQTYSLGIIAWDVTVSKNNPGDAGGILVKGRLYTQEIGIFIHEVNNPSSPLFYILTREGFRYKLEFNNLDPINIRFSSNNVGIIRAGDQAPINKSVFLNQYSKSSNYNNWHPDSLYLYNPQAKDIGVVVNNKMFFNLPDPTLPVKAFVTDVFANNTYEDWLLRQPSSLSVTLTGFQITGANAQNVPCVQGSIQEALGGTLSYISTQMGVAELSLDLNNNGSYNDPGDRKIYGYANAGPSSIFWDGKDGLGNNLPAASNFVVKYRLAILAGGMHVLMWDVENSGGFGLTLLNNLGTTDINTYYFDHSGVGGGVSGGGVAGAPLPTSALNTFSNNFGNEKMLDYWKFYQLNGTVESSIIIDIVTDCVGSAGPDADNDGITNAVDLDDDNDGVPDMWEFCNPNGSFDCLPGGFDPSGDQDADGVPNYLDAKETNFNSGCIDDNNDGICDRIAPVFDIDGDNVPDHFDLDSDNDGITDLVEAGHGQPDTNGNGIIDGLPAAFGPNGLYDPIDTDPNSLTSTGNYVRWDTDGDRVPDHDDLDSDNDGINDVAEAGYASADGNNDGRIDDGTGQTPQVGATGLAAIIDPAVTGEPIPLPPNTDGDGKPDWHDLDSDNDGIWDSTEAGVPDPDANGLVGTDIPVVNTNGQGTGTTSNPTNTDGDPAPDFQELDSDNDFIPDTDECPTGAPCVDGDGDSHPDFQDIDRDNDGINDNHECETSTPCVDTDGDGTSDVDDLDSDNDGLTDANECQGGAPCPDADNDGIPDFREYDCNTLVPGGIPTVGNLSGAGSFCEGENTVLAGANTNAAVSGALQYSWTGPGNFQANGTVAANQAVSNPLNNLSPTQSGSYALVLTGGNGCPSQPAVFNVTVAAKPQLPTIAASNMAPCANSSVALSTAAYTGGTATYEWYFNSGTGAVLLTTTANPTLAIANFAAANVGQYSVIVNANGCKSTVSAAVALSITQPDVPLEATNSAQNTAACAGQSVQLAVPTIVGATYTWTGPNNFTSNQQNPILASASVADAGAYSVQVTINGCTFNSNATQVNILPAPVQPTMANNGPVCAGSNATLTVQNNYGAGVKYLWYNAQGTLLGETTAPQFVITDPQSGDYTVAVQVGACVSPTSTTTLVVKPAAATPAIMASSTTPCAGSNVQISVTAYPGSAVTYSWYYNNGVTQFLLATTQTNIFNISSFSNNTSGSYLALVNVDGCTSTLSPPVTINVATPSVPLTATNSTTTTPACAGESVQLFVPTLAGATYLWTGPNNFTSSLQNPIIPNISASNVGTYSAKVTVNGCVFQSSSTQVNIATQPAQPVLANNGPVCQGADAVLSVSNNYPASATYAWYDDNGTLLGQTTTPQFTLTNAQGANYQVVVSIGACVSAPTETTLTVFAQPATPVLAANDASPCANSTVTLTTNGYSGANVSYDWFNGPNLIATTTVPQLDIPNFSASNDGFYYVAVHENGCVSVAASAIPVNVVNIGGAPVAANSAATAVCEGQPIQFSVNAVPGATYAWSGPNGYTANVQNPQIVAATTANQGAYSVIITLDGCTFASNSTQANVKATPAQPMLTNNGPICNGATLTLNVTNNYPNGATYNWYNPQGVLMAQTNVPQYNATNAQGGNYTVTVEVNGCASSVSAASAVQIAPPPAQPVLTNNGPVCQGSTLVLSVTNNYPANTTYNWYDPQGTLLAQTTVPQYSPATAQAGNYTSIVNVNGCFSAVSAGSNVTLGPVQVPLTMSNNGPICAGGSVTLTVQDYPGNLVYKWYDPQGNLLGQTTAPQFSVNNAQSGVYVASVEVDGCALSLPSTTLQVDQVPNQTATIVGQVAYACGDNDLIVKANAPNPGQGQWSTLTPGITFSNANANETMVEGISQATSFIVWSLSNGACLNYASDTLQIKREVSIDAQDDAYNVPYEGDLTNATILANDNAGNVAPLVISFLQNPDHGSATFTNQTLNYSAADGYYGQDVVKYLICSANCPNICDQATVLINVEKPTNVDIFIPNVITPNNDDKNDVLEIKALDLYPNNRLCIFNRWGDVVLDVEGYDNKWGGTWNDEDLPAGTYFILLFPDKSNKDGAISRYLTIVR